MCCLCMCFKSVLSFCFPWDLCPELLRDPVFVCSHDSCYYCAPPQAVSFLLQPEFRSAILFLNGLISSTFPILSRSLYVSQAPVGLPSITLFSSLTFPLHPADDFTFHSCPSMDLCPGIGVLLALITVKNKSFLGLSLLDLAGSEFLASQLSCVFVFHGNSDHKAEGAWKT